MISKNFKRTTCQIVLKYYTEIDVIPRTSNTHTHAHFNILPWLSERITNSKMSWHLNYQGMCKLKDLSFFIQLAADIIEMGEVQTKHA